MPLGLVPSSFCVLWARDYRMDRLVSAGLTLSPNCFIDVTILEDSYLGHGAYGSIKKARYKGLTCAAKVLHPTLFPRYCYQKRLDEQSRVLLQNFLSECEKLHDLRHPNIVQFLGVYMDKNTGLPCLIMELLNRCLTDLLESSEDICRHVKINICHDVCLALAYLHSRVPVIVHRDLSSNNILLTSNLQAKLSDLGVAKCLGSRVSTTQATPMPGTPAYMPPEAFQGASEYKAELDMFSFGVLAIQVESRVYPDPGPSHKKIHVPGFTVMLEMPIPELDRRKDHICRMDTQGPLHHIALLCLRDEPTKRMSALEACKLLEEAKLTPCYKQSLEDESKKHQSQQSEISALRAEILQLRKEAGTKDAEKQGIQQLKDPYDHRHSCEKEFPSHARSDATNDKEGGVEEQRSEQPPQAVQGTQEPLLKEELEESRHNSSESTKGGAEPNDISLGPNEHRQPKATSLLDKLGQFLGLDSGDEDDAMSHLQKEIQSI